MVRVGAKTEQVLNRDIHVWYASKWRAVRDERLGEVRAEQSGSRRRLIFKAARRAHLHFLAALACAFSSGCCLAPNTVRTEVQHVSHLTQHFGPDRTNMGYEAFNVVAQWRKGGAYLDVGDGVNVSPRDGYRCIGGMCGPREIFTASVGYVFQVKQ